MNFARFPNFDVFFFFDLHLRFLEIDFVGSLPTLVIKGNQTSKRTSYADGNFFVLLLFP